MTITIRNEELILTKERAIFIPNEQLLAISDLHLGKSAHFRKAGLPIPSTLAQHDLDRLSSLLDQYQPNSLLINGDMFHHELNTDIDAFANWKDQYPRLKFIMVKGNHDRLEANKYQTLGIEIHDPTYHTSNFCFIHNALECSVAQLYPISGHVHPGVAIVGKAKQRLKFPCFYFGEKYAIMPAFSVFTGLSLVKPKINDQVFAITPTKVVKV